MKKALLILTIIVIIVATGVGVYFFVNVNKSKLVTFSDKLATVGGRDDRFGFLTGPEPLSRFAEIGVGFVRPHPGPLIWGNMQESKDGNISFDDSDKLIKEAQENKLNILTTLWPYAKWDQLSRSDAESCKVSDEFNPILGRYRCSPSDWGAYEAWLRAVVERYDGDGVEDMPGLTNPIKHWEVNNEPDIEPPPDKAEGLRFYVGGAEGYNELLKKTYEVIKKADPKAKVLIAGAAGGNEFFLDFYRDLFKDKQVMNYFDIANVHCISSGDVASFNVDPYKKMLAEFNIDKPIWVTEAEAFIAVDPDLNAAQVRASTQKALELGAEKIFFTAKDFKTPPGSGAGPGPHPEIKVEADPSLDGDNPEEAYKKIIKSAPK